MKNASEKDCRNGCTLVSFGKDKSERAISDAVAIYTHDEEDYTIVKHKDKSISYFPVKETEGKWIDLDRSKANNISHAHISMSSVLVAVGYDGSVVTWGEKNDGGSVEGAIGGLSNINEIYSSEYYITALKKDGSLAAWGDEAYFNDPEDDGYVALSTQLDKAKNIVKVEAGYESTLALSSDGKIFYWGDKSYGSDIIEAVGDKKVIDIVGAGYNYMALLEDGSGIRWRVFWNEYEFSNTECKKDICK